MTKKLSLLSLAGLAAMSLTACGGGSSDSGSTDTVSGSTADGPFQSGAAVTLYSVDASGTEAVVDSNIFVTDSLGTYSESGVSSLVGLHKLQVVGSFFQDSAGGYQDGTVDSYFFAPYDGSTDHLVYANLATHIVAGILELDASTTEDASAGQYQALLSANSLVMNLLEIDSSTDATAGDPSKINFGGYGVGSGGTAAYKTALTRLQVFAAALSYTYLNQNEILGSTGATMASLFSQIVTGFAEGKVLADIFGSAFSGRLEYYAADPVGRISRPSGAVTTFLNASDDVSGLTQIKGFSCGDASTSGLRNNVGLTYGTGATTLKAMYGSSGTVDTFTGITNASADAIQFRCPIRAFTSKDTTTDVGGGATPVGASADNWTGSFSLFVTPTTTSSQSVLATISQVNISVGDASSGSHYPVVPQSLAVEVPASANIVISYVDSSGTEKTYTDTNASGGWNFVDATTTGNDVPNINVHVGKFLRTIGVATNETLANFSTGGTYDMRLGFGVNIGYEGMNSDATGSGLMNLLPTDATVDNTRSLFFNDLQIYTAN